MQIQTIPPALPEGMPDLRYPPELPVSAAREELLSLIRASQVVIVCGDTGSGKTTQLPKMLVELGYGRDARIGCTQPRRLAAVSMAGRVAEELDCPLGGFVGYQVRFDNQCSDGTAIKFMTDGILLAELQGDRQWRQYDALIIDEVHERSLNIDLILGCLKRLLARRPELKVVISSATLDAERFAAFFDNAPVVHVEGRRYPVEDFYLPPLSDDEDVSQHVGRAIDWLSELDDRGDVLVFLPGEREIRETAELLRGRKLPGTEVLPLFARLSLSEQRRVFQVGRSRRIVLATNVAETSITIPRIHYVVDAGWVRLKRYNPRLRFERLQVEMISQASANQRRGRCGRVSEGVCVRLYPREALENAEAYTPPEIQRDSLADVILSMKLLGLPDIDRFPFVEPPRTPLVREGYETLLDIGALDQERRLTVRGRLIGRFPLDPTIARMIVQGNEEHCLEDILVLAAALAIQDPRERPVENREQADAVQARWKDPRSDFMTLLNLWTSWAELQTASHGKQRAFCRAHFLSYRRMREWANTIGELRERTGECGWKVKPWKGAADQRYAAIHRSILAGIPMQFGVKEERHEYRGTRDKRFRIFPGSALFGHPPEWMMAFEIVETSRVFARQAAHIDPAWVEQVAPHLCKAVYGTPAWNEAAGFVYADKTLMCGGLALMERKPVHYGPVNPSAAREIFIVQGLVPARLKTTAPWIERYKRLLDEVREMETRLRRPESLLDQHGLYDRLHRALPRDMHNAKDFGRWIRRNPDAIPLTLDDLLAPHAPADHRKLYPDTLAIEDIEFHLRYAFAPGEPHDGVCLVCPAKWACLVNENMLEWSIPGWLEEKVYALLRTLTPRIRQQLNPLRHAAARLAGSLLETAARADRWPPCEAGLAETLAAQLRDELREVVGARDFDPARIPHWLKMKVAFTDDRGNRLVQCETIDEARQALDHLAIPDAGSNALKSLPVNEDDAEEAERATLVARFRADHQDHVRFVERRLSLGTALRLHLRQMRYATDPLSDLIDGHIALLMREGPDTARERLYAEVEQAVRQLERIMTVEEAARAEVAALPADLASATLTDLAMQEAELYPPGSLRFPEYLADRARWARARRTRTGRARHNPEKDAAKLQPLLAARDQLSRLLETVPLPLRLWRGLVLFQEWRVAAFAPEVGVRQKSNARIMEEWLCPGAL